MINITGQTGLTGLLGSPVAHSVSPLMHNEAFRYLGLDYVYLCFDVTEETLPQAVEGLKACGIKGFNLTMPNKNKVQKRSMFLHVLPAVTGNVLLPWQKKCLI